MTRTLLLDLDGTLVDTVPDLASALNRLMRSRNLPDFTCPQVARMVGDGVHMLVKRAFAAQGRQPDDAAVVDFMTDYQAHVAVESALYPGVAGALAELSQAGWKLAVCTNKPADAAMALLRSLDVMPIICAVGAGDSFSVRKPDPGHLLSTLDLAQGEPTRAIMLGDHRNDVVAAAQAGMPSIFAEWGYGTPDMATGCTAQAASMTGAVAIANRLRP